MCIKSSNPEYFKMVLQKDYLKHIQFYCSKNSDVKKLYEDFFKDWVKSGIKPVSLEQNQPNTNPMIVPKEQSQPIKKTIDRSPEKLNQDLLIVKETMNFMKDLLKTSTSNKDLEQEEFQQVYLNLVEMRVRIMNMVETLPPENILLKLIQVNDDLFEVISSYEDYLKTGKKKETKKDETIEFFKEEKSNNSVDDMFSTLRNQEPSQKYMDPIEKEFSNISLRNEQPKVDELFGEISNRKKETSNVNNQIDINKLFENTQKETPKQNESLYDMILQPSAPTQPSAPKEEDLDLFGDIVNRKKEQPKTSNYDEFQKFLNNQKK